MSRKLALKKLKSSDLSFFKARFEKEGTAKQKAFNLDVKVMESPAFYPGLRTLLEPLPKKGTFVELTLQGPGLAPMETLVRRVKIDAKNIRLNGEFVHDPEGQTGRFASMMPDDFAVIEFVGTGLPSAVKVVLVSSASEQDLGLYAAFRKLLPNAGDSMIPLTEELLRSAVNEAAPVAGHPILEWLDGVLLEEAAVGNPEAIRQLNVSRPGRGISPDDFKESLAAAALTGELGEKLMDQWLSGTVQGVTSHEWVSITNAIAPFDFRIEQAGLTREADAKSTSGKFDTPLHLSAGEIRYATSSARPYDIYRLFEVKATGARMRVANDVRQKLQAVQAFIDACPEGAQVDSLTFKPDFFEFDPAVHVIEAED